MTDAAENSAAIIERREGAVAILTLSRPEARNAFDDPTRRAMIAACERLAAAPSVKAVVLTGAGPAFCAGGDIKAMGARLEAGSGEIAAAGWQSQALTQQLIATLTRLPKPTIAAVNGAAAGLGCDLALACDLIIAAPKASFAMSYIRMGLVPDGGGLYLLPRRIGLPRAKELIFSGRTVRQDEALAIGLADRGGGEETLVEEAVAWATELSSGSPLALALGKTILNGSLEASLDNVFERGRTAQAMCYTSNAHREAVTAFLSGVRPPR
ncbi:Enoyl-CoA hydratase/carnithine racemase [Devosia enhydra]|uniref:Enoyl-CoA hydratase/carnithine racemase n=1 Tax=Devosia enhydra TaxID=665118 RepID=A0A1K2HUG2_9HYPH|nr:enoyl-CoA hydratase-related protein [Devosia enhydra]SFZ81883.1 Enoyl-CoA hydratase/carnithine racemase [Devosia enhydra]